MSTASGGSRPDPSAHHGPGGRFRNPWTEAAEDDAVRKEFPKVAWEWLTTRHPPDPDPSALPTKTPRISHPVSREGEVRITWVGHATALVQLPGLNVLTDPVWSPRAGPFGRVGPRRFVPAVPELEDLPPVHAVLLSHDHYDHLDHGTVRALHARYGDELLWCAPLGHRAWLRRRGITRVAERDWWQEAELPEGRGTVVCVPARHWSRRTPFGTNRRLWCGWVIRTGEDRSETKVFYAGDTGYSSLFREVGTKLGPFHAALLPVGAYRPRWFMKSSHMDPEEAVQAWEDLGKRGIFLAMHWGTFRLTFEDPLEPPIRARRAWETKGHPPGDLRIPHHGETVVCILPRAAERRGCGRPPSSTALQDPGDVP
jgi:N-acyl-phosphatidylethanolamine-hydrolysing phospholipase D